jgi:hypothetical protein
MAMPNEEQVRAMLQAQQGQQGPGKASQLVAQINTMMGQLADMMGQSQSIDDSDKQAFQDIMTSYQSFVQNNLGSAPGTSQKTQSPYGEPKPLAGSVPQEAGANPNAVPMPQ